MSLSLEGQVALVTGASRGIGRAVALRLAQSGAQIGVNYHNGEAQAKEVVEQIVASGGQALALQADVSDEGQVAHMFRAIMDRWQRLDILINNAGIRRDRLLMRMSAEEWDEVIKVNLKSAYLCSKAALAHMVRQRKGRIVNISSVVGLSGNPGQANYAASKAALIGLTKTIAREVGSRNITANALAPGYITTGMVAELSEERKEQVLLQVPMGRFGSPQDVAGMVAFLCSDEATYVTGQVIGIDGGLAI